MKKAREESVQVRLTVLRASVLVRSGVTDRVYLTTTIPGPFKPEVDPGTLTLTFDAPKGKGEEYVIANFGIRPVVIPAG